MRDTRPEVEIAIANFLWDVPLSGAVVGVVLPFLQEVGERWEAGTLSVAHEHFVSDMLRRKRSARSARPARAVELLVVERARRCPRGGPTSGHPGVLDGVAPRTSGAPIRAASAVWSSASRWDCSSASTLAR